MIRREIELEQSPSAYVLGPRAGEDAVSLHFKAMGANGVQKYPLTRLEARKLAQLLLDASHD